jgi:hypothetical protein
VSSFVLATTLKSIPAAVLFGSAIGIALQLRNFPKDPKRAVRIGQLVEIVIN